MASLSRTLVLMSVAACLGVGVLSILGSGSDEIRTVRSLDADTDPIATITPLPETISNGTRYNLDGSSSIDPFGYLVNHTWKIVHENTTWYLYGISDEFTFRDQGLYKITLTVTDGWGNTDDDFTAVVSVDDSDFDEMPDWWELAYFESLDEVPTGDFDGDGYTDLQEYAAGTDPTSVDPPPPSAGFLEENWMYVVIATAAFVAVMLAMVPRMRKKRKALETKKIEYAIEIEKTLEEE